MPFQPGDTVTLDTTFKVDDVLTDPTAVTLTVRAPDGTQTAYVYLTDAEVVKDSTGTYHADIVVDAAGIWAWEWEGTGAAAGVDEGTFTVEATLLGANVLCSVDDVQTALESPNADEDLIQALINSASSAIAQRYQREFVGPTGGTRSFPVRERLVDLAPYDLRGTTAAVTLHPEEAAQALTLNGDYMLLPEGGSRLGGTYMQIRLSGRLVLNSTLYREFGQARLQVAGDWGLFSAGAVDESVKRACALTVASWLDRAVAEYALSPLSEDGRLMRPDQFGTYAIPSSAHSLLSPWGRLGTP